MVNRQTNSGEKRRRGGQPGNLNALKHGFYSRQFRDEEVADLEEQFAGGLLDEIAMMKIVTRRVLEKSEEADSMCEQLKLLGAMGMATTRLMGLMKAQKLVFGGQDDVSSALSDVIDQLMDELEKENSDG